MRTNEQMKHSRMGGQIVLITRIQENKEGGRKRKKKKKRKEAKPFRESTEQKLRALR